MPVPTNSADLVMFAISSAVKIGGNIRKAYVSNLQSKELTLPLPKVDMNATNFQISDFFALPTNGHFLEENTRLSLLYNKSAVENLNDAETKEYFNFFDIAFKRQHVASDSPIQGDDLVALLTFRQWANDADAPPTGLRLVAGSLVEVGIDYFVQTPGALNPNAKHAAPLRSFLEALDGIDLTSNNIKGSLLKQVAPQIFAAAIEVTNSLASEITADPHWQAMIKETSAGITKDLCQRLDGLKTDAEQQDAQLWGKAVFRSMATHAGTAMMANLPSLQHPRMQKAAMLGGIGVSIMQTLLDGKAGEVSLKDLFSGENADKLMQSALNMLAEHPELLSKNTLIASTISDLAMAVGKIGVKEAQLLPELSRILLEKTALNIHLIMGENGEKHQTHLLTITIQQTLLALSQAPKKGNWKPQLSHTQLIGIASTLMDEVVQHPQWVTEKIGKHTLLSEVLQVSLEAMQGIPSERRLGAEALTMVVKTSVQAVAVNRLLLDKLPILADGEMPTALGYLLSATFARLYGNAEQAQKQFGLAKNELLSEILNRLLSQITNQPISIAIIDNALTLEFGGVENRVLQGFLASINGVCLGDNLKDVFFQKVAPQLAQNGLAVLQEISPSLSKDPHFQTLITGTAQQLGQSLAMRMQGQWNESEREAWEAWGNDLLGNLVRHASRLALDSSQEFFGVSDEEMKFVQAAGAAIIEVGATQGLASVLKGEALDKVVGALLQSLSAHPEAFAKQESVQRIVSDLAKAAMESGIRRPGLVPALMQIALEKASGQLHLIWDPTGGRSPMALAIQSLLSALAQPPQDGKWRPQFTASQMSDLAGQLLDEVVRNPAWVTEQLGAHTVLHDVLAEALRALEVVPIQARLNAETAQLVLRSSVKAVALRRQLLDKIPKKHTMLHYALDGLFTYLFQTEDNNVRWAATQSDILKVVLEHYLQKIAIEPAETSRIDALLEKLKTELGKIGDNVAFDSTMLLRDWIL